VLAWARPVLQSAGHLADGIATLRADHSARLRVAASLTVAEYLMPRWLLLLRRNHPDLETAVEVVNSHHVAEHVRAGTVDLGFVETPQPPAGLHATLVGHDRITLVVASTYPLAARASRPLDKRELLDHPLLLREPGSGTRDTFMTAIGITGGDQPAPPHTIELGSNATIVATALAGGGIGVVSARAVARELDDGNLVELHVSATNLQRPLHAVWTGRRPNELSAELVALAQSAARRGRSLTGCAQ
jgi:DNA-binding transcriptional LysR family regulator